MAVFVTDGDQRSTLAVVRALGGAGISVTVGHNLLTSLAGSSRYCANRISYPSPLEEGRRFQAFLCDEIPCGRWRVLLPMTDVTMRLVAEVRECLAPLVRLPIPAEKQVELAQDKRHVVLLARKLGMACPETYMLSEGENLQDLVRTCRYPVVIKPRFSRFLRDGSWVAGNVEYAYDPEDLIARYRQSHERIPYPLVQEKIDGEGRGIFLLLWDNELKAAFCHRRLREQPPWGGVSVYRESIAMDEGLVEKSLALLRAISWQGVAMVEFKVDQRDGQAKLMEVNGRFWGSLQLAVDAGMNFPLLLYRLACGENVPAQFNYQGGVKSRWLLGDLDHLLIRLTRSCKSNGLSGCQGPKLRACVDFLKFYERNLHYEVFRVDDPNPGWFECKTYLRRLLRHFTQRQERPRAH